MHVCNITYLFFSIFNCQKVINIFCLSFYFYCIFLIFDLVLRRLIHFRYWNQLSFFFQHFLRIRIIYLWVNYCRLIKIFNIKLNLLFFDRFFYLNRNWSTFFMLKKNRSIWWGLANISFVHITGWLSPWFNTIKRVCYYLSRFGSLEV